MLVQLLLAFQLVAPVSAQARALDAGQVVDRVQEFYRETDQLTAKFRQTVFDPIFGREETSDGIVYIKKPGKMRWDYWGQRTASRPARRTKSFISDGKELWAVQHDDRTAMRQDLKKDVLPVAVTFLYGKGNLARDFDAELDTSGKYGARGDYVIKLTPKRPTAQYRHLWLVVDPQNFRVKQSIVLNAANETNSFRFFEPDTNRAIADNTFVFRPGKDYRVVRPDENR